MRWAPPRPLPLSRSRPCETSSHHASADHRGIRTTCRPTGSVFRAYVVRRSRDRQRLTGTPTVTTAAYAVVPVVVDVTGGDELGGDELGGGGELGGGELGGGELDGGLVVRVLVGVGVGVGVVVVGVGVGVADFVGVGAFVAVDVLAGVFEGASDFVAVVPVAPTTTPVPGLTPTALTGCEAFTAAPPLWVVGP